MKKHTHTLMSPRRINGRILAMCTGCAHLVPVAEAEAIRVLLPADARELVEARR